MKKFLSLALALVMALSLVTISAGAKDFSDKSKINYTEAVNTLTGIGVIDGYTDGSFGPTGNITRGAAAKIICNLVLGPTTAAALGTTTAPFKDVPTSNTFAGYIAYCSSQGIINGYSDGTFRPANSVTGYQFLKMLLGALGYDSTIEQFTGSNWAVNVAKLAAALSLTDGNSSFVGTKAATREEACLYAFNTLLATMVDYSSKGTTITINGATIATGASKAEAIKIATTTYTDKNSNGTLEFYERYFTNMNVDTKTLDGRYGRSISYKGTTISDFGTTDTVLATSTDGTALADLVASNNSSYIGYKASTAVWSANTFASGQAAGNVVYFLNGKYAGMDATGAAAVATTVAKRGVVTKFQDMDSDGKYDIVSVTLDAVAKVAAAPSTTTSGAVTTVTVSGIAGLSAINVKNVYGYASLAKGDYVMWHTDGTNYFLTKCDSFTGKMTATTGTSTVVIDGTNYKVSEITNAQTQAQVKAEAWGKDGSTFYKDTAGYIVKAVASTTAVDLTSTLYAVDASRAVGYSNQTKVLFSDGTESIITISKLDSTSTTVNTLSSTVVNGAAANTFYTYTKNTDGTYALKSIPSSNNTATLAYTGTHQAITKNQSNFLTNDSNNLAGVLATSGTTFVVSKNSPSTGYNVYTGIANAPTVTTANGSKVSYLCDSDGYAIWVVSLGGTSSNAASTLDYVFATGAATETYVSSSESYYTFPAVVNGAVTTTDATASNKLNPGTLMAVTSYDGKKVAAATATMTDTLIVNFSGNAASPALANVDNITINGTSIKFSNNGTMTGSGVVSSNTLYFIYDNTKTPATITASTAEEVDALTGGSYTIQAVKKSSTDSTIAQLFVTKDAASDVSMSATLAAAATPAIPIGGTLTASGSVTSLTASTAYVLTVTADPNAVITYAVNGGTAVATTGAINVTTGASGDTVVAITVTNNGHTATYAITLTVAP